MTRNAAERESVESFQDGRVVNECNAGKRGVKFSGERVKADGGESAVTKLKIASAGEDSGCYASFEANHKTGSSARFFAQSSIFVLLRFL